jgi:hypothetical protein
MQMLCSFSVAIIAPMKSIERIFTTDTGKAVLTIYAVALLIGIAKAGYQFGHWLAS